MCVNKYIMGLIGEKMVMVWEIYLLMRVIWFSKWLVIFKSLFIENYACEMMSGNGCSELIIVHFL